MATITNLQGSTQIGNSDEIINANFQNINNAMVENTGDESIAGLKTFTDTNFYRDATSNTENTRRLVDKRKVKNESDAGGVDFALYVDADNSVVGNRMWSLRGYPKKTADGSIGGSESFISCNFPTYDGATTYTKKTTINSELTVGTQDRTGAWTSYTPVVSGTSGTVTTYTSQQGHYYQLGKNVFYEVNIIVSDKGTLSGQLSYSLPLTCANSLTEMIQTGGVYTPGGIVNKGLPVVYNGTIGHFLVGVDTGALQRSPYANGDVIRVQGRFTIA